MFCWRTQSLISLFWRTHNTNSNGTILYFWDYICLFVLFFEESRQGQSLRGTFGHVQAREILIKGSLRTVRCLYQNCWVMHSRGSLQTRSCTRACMQTLESALPCSAHQKAPLVISFGKKDEHFNANPLNMIFIQLCTTCLWIKNILLKKRGLSHGTGRKASCTCLSLAA